MTNKILVPPEIVEIEGQIIFLAGPIQGAPDWQSKAIGYIHKINRDIAIANPRRAYMDNTFVYEKQVDWETHYLRKAGENGVIMFWLAKEAEHDCKRAYAQTTRFELGEWKRSHETEGSNLAVGIEAGFSGERYIRRRMRQDCPYVKVCSSLEETCEEAVRILRG